MSEFDFEANLKDGIAVDWPIRYKDIAPWYDYVEDYIGVQGRAEGLPQFPDGKFLKPFELNVLEQHMRNSISNNFSDGRILSNARTAHITEGTKPGLGRVTCQYRNRCMITITFNKMCGLPEKKGYKDLFWLFGIKNYKDIY